MQLPGQLSVEIAVGLDVDHGRRTRVLDRDVLRYDPSNTGMRSACPNDGLGSGSDRAQGDLTPASTNEAERVPVRDRLLYAGRCQTS